MRQTEQVALHDVTDMSDEALTIVAGVFTAECGDDGVVIYTPVGECGADQRVVVENRGGKLVVHVWSTIDSLGNDPTHSIDIEGGQE